MVGKKIRAYREFRGINQVQLAELSGINVGTIRKYELGIRNPKPDQLEKIASALGLNVSVFLDFNIDTVSDVLSLLYAVQEEWMLRSMGTTVGCHVVVRKGTEGNAVKLTDLT